MNVVLLAFGFVFAAIATVLGFGWVTDDPELLNDWPGWYGLAVACFIASFIPWGRLRS